MEQIKTNRSLLMFILLSGITCGIYTLFFISAWAKDVNVICAGDGKETKGLLMLILLSLVTFGIYEIIWMYGLANRLGENLQARGIDYNVTGMSVLLWTILGSALCGVGPFVALYKMFKATNELAVAYNG